MTPPTAARSGPGSVHRTSHDLLLSADMVVQAIAPQRRDLLHLEVVQPDLVRVPFGRPRGRDRMAPDLCRPARGCARRAPGIATAVKEWMRIVVWKKGWPMDHQSRRP